MKLPVAFALLFLSGWLLLTTGCKPSTPTQSPPAQRSFSYQRAVSEVADDTHLLTRTHIGAPVGDRPWIGHVNLVDLDGDGLMDIVATESKHNTVFWLRQLEDGSFEEITIGTNLRAPVHVQFADMTDNGHLDVIVSSMSVVFPNNDEIGAIFILENDGECNFTPHLIIENIARVVDVRAADFNGNGKMDLAVGQFGYDQGEIRWMKRTGLWEFESEILLNLSGTVNIAIADFNENGALDIAALVTQQWQEVHLFFNDGQGNFTNRVVWGSTNEDYSCSGMSMGDMNQNGRMDLVFSNGDGFGPNPEPGPKPWHGVQWLENMGNGFFRYHRIGDLGGAYSPVIADFNGNGHMDVIALAGFNDWSDPSSESMVWFKNDGNQRFQKRVLAYEPIQLITVAAGHMRGPDKPISIVTGGFHAYPPYDVHRHSRILIWEFKD